MKEYIQNLTGDTAYVHTYDELIRVTYDRNNAHVVHGLTKEILDTASIDLDGTIYFYNEQKGYNVHYSRKDYEESNLVLMYIRGKLFKVDSEDMQSYFTPVEKSKEVTINPSHVTMFMTNGTTLRFDNVEFIDDDLEQSEFRTETVIAFWYTSAGDGLRKIAVFDMSKSGIAGYSVYSQKLSEDINDTLSKTINGGEK